MKNKNLLTVLLTFVLLFALAISMSMIPEVVTYVAVKKYKGKYDIICIGDTQYYQNRNGVRGFLAVRLNNDLTPARCGE